MFGGTQTHSMEASTSLRLDPLVLVVPLRSHRNAQDSSAPEQSQRAMLPASGATSAAVAVTGYLLEYRPSAETSD